MATTFVEVLLQLRDQFGADVLAGSKIYTYEAGTTTPLATFTDLAGATANTNPVILDSAGMAVIRQTDGVAYKWLVYDAQDNLLFTRDNITVGLSAFALGGDYQVHMTYLGTVADGAWMGGHVFLEAINFPIDFEGSRGTVETAPAASYVITIRKNGAAIGTATISTAGAYTFATTGGSSVSFETGDKMTFTGPATAGTAGNFLISLLGTY